MKGLVLYFDSVKRVGVIRADDGNRYGFIGLDYKSDHAPGVGDQVDFEIPDRVATEIYSVRTAAQPTLDLGAIRRSIAEGTNRVAEQLTRNWAGQAAETAAATHHASDSFSARMMSDWRNMLAVLALAFCFLPLVSYGPNSSNLFGAVSGASTLRIEFANYQRLLQPVQPAAQNYNPWNMIPAVPAQPRPVDARQGSGSIWVLRLVPLLYAIPALALFMLLQVFRGRSTAAPAFWLGATCTAVVPGVMVVGNEVSAMASQLSLFGTAPSLWNVLDFGFYGLVAVGVSIILIHLGIIGARPPRAYLTPAV